MIRATTGSPASPNRSTPARTVLFLAAFALVFAAGILAAGPLNPPAGAVTSTYKTLTEVEPRTAVNTTNTPGDADSVYKITQRGSYYLTGDVIGSTGQYGIEIAADNVSIDLNGFSVVNSGLGLDGVSTAGIFRVSITIRDGVISAWGDWAIDLVGTGHRVENVLSRVCTNGGIRVGASAIVTGCSVSGSLGDGYSVTGSGSALRDCTAVANSAQGFIIAGGATLANCTANANASTGFNATADGVTFDHCTSANNAGRGFVAANAATLTGCVASDNGSYGFLVSRGAIISQCTSDSNATIGIQGSFGVTIERCIARFNGEHGILVGSACDIRDNVTYLNAQTQTTAAGITTNGGLNRIEGNQSIQNGHGIWISGAGANFIARNTCGSNTVTNWEIVAGNNLAPIVQATPNAATVSGNTYTGSVGTTNPWANLTY
ncbi:MAG: right-handed parallel beta-helix repeat-containing protein [Planctomycetota bacterium]